MRFYDRIAELGSLENIRKQSLGTSCFTALIGRRRIGKTLLLLKESENKDSKSIYLLVGRMNEGMLCEHFQEEAEKTLGIKILGRVVRFRELFEALMQFGQTEPLTLILDEFQEFGNVNSAIYSDIQDIWDRYKASSRVNLIACGSIYSLMVKIFEGQKEPLFGRLSSKIVLHPFRISVIKQILRDYFPKYDNEDLLCLYMLTGGVPKYIELLMDSGAFTKGSMLERVTAQDSVFLWEGRDLLISEFGRDYGTYFSILKLISVGKTTQAEIDSVIGKNTGAYLHNLENEYALISKNRPIFSPPNSRKCHWAIDDDYLRFWFRFIYPNQYLIETGRTDLLKEIIDKGYEQYSGYVLERYFRKKLSEEGRLTTIGGYWDNKGQNEIDIVALNDLDKKATIAEVKRNSTKINMSLLAQKSKSLSSHLHGYDTELIGLSMEDM